jgi:cellulose synthase/poly-beta-1,6-N-acetylglucosamine synthase-like glycosyltransferase
MNPELSFLIPAHNEEKIISKTLNNLVSLPYKNYEVLIGLDGCTDRTEEIVDKFVNRLNNFKKYKLKSRNGKPEVVDSLIKKSTGEIIIINDADWIFKVDSEEKLSEFFGVFNDSKIGGIAESFPVEWDEDKLRKGNFWYKSVAYGNYFWIQSQKDLFSKKRGGLIYINESGMFLTNIFRKDLYKKNVSLGDDFERTRDVKNQGFEIVVFNDESSPRMIASYENISFRDLLKQKIRTSIARKQVSKKEEDFAKYQNKIGRQILIKSWREGILPGVYATSWLAVTLLGSLIAKSKNVGTKEGWTMRAER